MDASECSVFLEAVWWKSMTITIFLFFDVHAQVAGVLNRDSEVRNWFLFQQRDLLLQHIYRYTHPHPFVKDSWFKPSSIYPESSWLRGMKWWKTIMGVPWCLGQEISCNDAHGGFRHGHFKSPWHQKMGSTFSGDVFGSTKRWISSTSLGKLEMPKLRYPCKLCYLTIKQLRQQQFFQGFFRWPRITAFCWKTLRFQQDEGW